MHKDNSRKPLSAELETINLRPRYESPKVIPLSQLSNGVGQTFCGTGSHATNSCDAGSAPL